MISRKIFCLRNSLLRYFVVLTVREKSVKGREKEKEVIDYYMLYQCRSRGIC